MIKSIKVSNFVGEQLWRTLREATPEPTAGLETYIYKDNHKSNIYIWSIFLDNGSHYKLHRITEGKGGAEMLSYKLTAPWLDGSVPVFEDFIGAINSKLPADKQIIEVIEKIISGKQPCRHPKFNEDDASYYKITQKQYNWIVRTMQDAWKGRYTCELRAGVDSEDGYRYDIPCMKDGFRNVPKYIPNSDQYGRTYYIGKRQLLTYTVNQ